MKLLLAIAAAIAVPLSCLAGEQPKAQTQTAAIDQALAAQLQVGARVFEHWCQPCHDAGPGHPGTMRLGLRLGERKSVLLERDDLVDVYVKTVVRLGFQMMPPFKETEISDAELDAVAAYVVSKGGSDPTALKERRR